MVRGHAARSPRKAGEPRMTGRAIGAGGNMCRRLRDRGDTGKTGAVVTGGTPGHDPSVIHRCAGAEGRRYLVACRAIGRGRDVARGLRFRHDTCEGLAAVAGGAPGGDPGVIHFTPAKVVNPALLAGHAVAVVESGSRAWKQASPP